MSGIDCDVLVSGGGLAGNTLAALLARAGLECIVIEAGEKLDRPAPDPRALAITHASRHILDATGVWQHLPADRIGCFRGMHVWDENGSGQVVFDCADLCHLTLGYIIEQSTLQAGLEHLVSHMPGAVTRHNTRPLAVNWQDRWIEVRLDSGDSLKTRLMVGADGAGSITRELAGISSAVRDYHQQAVACLVDTGLPHEDIARQRFLSHGPLAFLPMHAENQCGIVWSTRPDHAQALMQMPEAEFNRTVQQAFAHTLGEISGSQPRCSFPLRRAQAEHYCSQRLALIGDAAHSIHPLAGQGANLGLLDAASLAQVIVEAKNKDRDIASQRVLRSYERWRKFENKKMMMILEGFKYTFENQAPPVPVLRNRALDLANSIAPLKHTIMRHAMGLSGDLPELARGGFA